MLADGKLGYKAYKYNYWRYSVVTCKVMGVRTGSGFYVVLSGPNKVVGW